MLTWEIESTRSPEKIGSTWTRENLKMEGQWRKLYSLT